MIFCKYNSLITSTAYQNEEINKLKRYVDRNISPKTFFKSLTITYEKYVLSFYISGFRNLTIVE